MAIQFVFLREAVFIFTIPYNATKIEHDKVKWGYSRFGFTHVLTP
jgi:hypothetical protein